MKIRKNRLAFIFFMLLAMFYCKNITYGIGYLEGFNSVMTFEEEKSSYFAVLILIIPPIIYFFIGLLCYLKPKIFEPYLVNSFEKYLKDESNLERLDFGLSLIGVLLIALSFPIIINLLFRLTVFGFDGFKTIASYDNSFLLSSALQLIAAIFFGFFGLILIYRKDKFINKIKRAYDRFGL